MIAILVKLREPMIPYCVSEELQDKCVGEEDYNLLANYISVYNSTTPDETYIVGYTNTEDLLLLFRTVLLLLVRIRTQVREKI